MKKSRFSEEQIIGILREAGGDSPVKVVCAKHNVSEGTFYTWKKKYGGMDVAEARRLRALEEENGPAQATGGRSGGATANPQGDQRKKMVSPSTKRRAVKASIEEGLGSAAVTCRAPRLARSSFYRSGRQSVESQRVRREILELSRNHPRYGYRRAGGIATAVTSVSISKTFTMTVSGSAPVILHEVTVPAQTGGKPQSAQIRTGFLFHSTRNGFSSSVLSD